MLKVEKRPGSWDSGIDYKKAYKTILKYINTIKEQKKLKTRSKKLAKAIILLIQLRNASRIGEAIEAFRKFKEERKREVRVRVEKRKDGAERLMILPEEVKIEDLDECDDENLYPENLNDFCKRTFVFERVDGRHTRTTTHGLRYAAISELFSKGISAPAVAKAIGRKKHEDIGRYFEQDLAEKILREQL